MAYAGLIGLQQFGRVVNIRLSLVHPDEFLLAHSTLLMCWGCGKIKVAVFIFRLDRCLLIRIFYPILVNYRLLLLELLLDFWRDALDLVHVGVRHVP